jgi:TolB-like protein/tetratricopeptide (TPR) repeat protein
MAEFFAKLKRRNIFRVAAAYAVVAWVVMQLAANVTPILDLPPWIARAVLLLLVIGFPLALVFAWVHEIAPGSVTRGAGWGDRREAGPSRADWILTGALVAVIAIFVYQQLVASSVVTTRPGVDSAKEAAASPGAAVSLAVLPFANLSGDPSQEFFSDGITEEITSALAKVPDLRVVARTSAYQFRNQNRDIQSIGQQLRATHFIEGSVRKAGDRVRITAQLIRADDATHVWAETFDRELTDVFAIQEDIATAIAAALRVPLGLQPGAHLTSGRGTDPASYDQYLRAKALTRARGFDRLSEAARLLEPLVARDAGFAPAWAVLAHVYFLLTTADPEASVLRATRTGSLEAARQVTQSYHSKAEMAAREAVRRDSQNALAYAVLARIQERRGRWAEAEDLHKQALSLDPSDPDIQLNYILLLGATGRIREALPNSERLRALEPFVPVYTTQSASLMQQSGQILESIALLEELPAERGGFNRNVFLAMAYAEQGHYAEAADTLLLIMNVPNAPRPIVEEAARLLRTAPRVVNDPEALPELGGGLGFVYAHIGAVHRIAQGYETALENRLNFGTGGAWTPALAPMRKAERFKTYVRNAGLVDYWRERGWPDLCRPVGADDFVCE